MSQPVSSYQPPTSFFDFMYRIFTKLSDSGCFIWIIAMVVLLFTSSGFSGCSGVNTSQYNKIQPGMAAKDVETILGPGQPVAIEDVQAGGDHAEGKLWGQVTKARVWTGGNSLIIIFFHDNKVVAKLSKGLS